MAYLGVSDTSLTATYFLNISNTNLNKSIARLSSGSNYAIPGDKAGGTVVGIMDTTVRRLNGVLEGVQGLISYQSTAASYIQSVQDTYNALADLIGKASSAAYTDTERVAMQAEFTDLVVKARAMVSNASYNGSLLFTGLNPTQTLSMTGQTFTTDGAIPSSALTALTSVSISSAASAGAGRTTLEASLTALNADRSSVQGDIQELTAIASGVGVEVSNKSTALSNIRDVNFAKESTILARNNILVQSATAMLAQANSSMQNALALLR